MPWAGRTWAELYKETVYGTFSGAGAKLFPVLYAGNSMTVRQVPQRQVIRSADAGNRARQVVANRMVYAGTLNTLLYPSQAAYWATALTLASNDLPSYSMQYWDSVRAWQLTGGKIQKWALTSNAQQDYTSLSIDWIFQTNDDTFTTFTEPAQSNYPTENPYCHVETSTNMLLATVPVTKYKSWSVTMSNVLAPTYDENPNITSLYYCGRDFTFNFNPQFIAKAYRDAFEIQTPQTFVLQWKRATQNITFSCNASSYYTNCTDDLPLDGPGYQSLDGHAFFDLAATSDVAITAV